ncbi:MAG: FAD-dependent oxidoreductase [Crocinitomix sp.]|nr:FAD-dependent oxidoreductase [Crocinitomix sp.]
MQKVTIIGAGVIGLCAAYYLNQKGFAVTIIDQGKEQEANCSFGNAGMIVPSHFVPLAAPGIITKGLKWMINPTSPFYIKPKLDLALMNWLWQFYKHATADHVEKSSQLLHDLNRISNELYSEINHANLFDFDYERKGLMMLYNSDKCGQEELELAQKAKSMGIKVETLTPQRINEIQQTKLNVKGGIFFPGDAHLNPNKFMQNMRSYLLNLGVEFKWETRVEGLSIEKNKVQNLNTNRGEFRVDKLLIATGSWTPKLAKVLRLKLPIQAGKGYSFNMNSEIASLVVPSVLCEAKVAVTPLGNETRFAGTMGIEGLSLKKNTRRILAIKKAIPNYFSSVQEDQIDVGNTWVGLRPCSPDGLPFIGKCLQDNVLVAAGHAMMGMSLGPITGKIISEMLTEEKLTIGVEQLSPLRYS